MANYFGLAGSLIASAVALVIATMGWRRSDRTAQHATEHAETLRQQDSEDVRRKEQAALLAELLELSISAESNIVASVPRMKAILLTLPGHLATLLRVKLGLDYTMKDVPLDAASAARLRPDEKHDAGHKWLIFDRSSVLTNRALDRRHPYPEWVEAELAYDIAGLRGGDQDAVLAALSKDVRDPKDAAIAMLQKAKQES